MSSKQPVRSESGNPRWFASADKGVPAARFEDVTMEIDLGDVTVAGETLPPIIPPPARRTNTPLPTGGFQDAPFGDLNVILREVRAVLVEKRYLNEAEVDAVEWLVRTKIARL